MRDPDGAIEITDGEIIRFLFAPIGVDHFLRSKLAADLVRQGKLIQYSLRDEKIASSPRLPFVSQPTEWCDSQLFDAASLTLDLAQRSTATGFDLKDASAWNVLFQGTQPVFCDLLSFQPSTMLKWWAAGQFTRHFILPLWLAQKRGLHGFDSFKCWRDGVEPQQARELLGPARYLHRCWPLVAEGGHLEPVYEVPDAVPSTGDLAFRSRLYTSLRWMLSGVRPAAAANAYSRWSSYSAERNHYPGDSLVLKRQQVGTWLHQTAPSWVVDFGCNTGEFSGFALAEHAHVIALDADHACIERLYRAHPGQGRLYPVVASLDDLSAGRGWAGKEQPGLPARLAARADLAMMLALLHHLSVGASVPLVEVARFARACTRRWLIVEWIDPEDSQLSLLGRQRGRSIAAFSVQAQRQAFLDAGFVVRKEFSLTPAPRILALLEVSS
jgi:hypothetical protein